MAPPAPQIPEKWKLLSWQKKDEQFSRIPSEWRLPNLPQEVTIDVPRTCGLLSKTELKITEEYDATSLAQAIRNREVKCADVARAFCKVPCTFSIRLSEVD